MMHPIRSCSWCGMPLQGFGVQPRELFACEDHVPEVTRLAYLSAGRFDGRSRRGVMTYRIPTYRVQLVREKTLSFEGAKRIATPADAVPVLRELCINQRGDREVLAVVYLNGRNVVIGAEVVAVGGAHGCAVTAPEIFRGALLAGASAIILGHNHPSGDPDPSDDDIAMTITLVKAGEAIGIVVGDHVVVTDDAYVSMLERDRVRF